MCRVSRVAVASALVLVGNVAYAQAVQQRESSETLACLTTSCGSHEECGGGCQCFPWPFPGPFCIQL